MEDRMSKISDEIRSFVKRSYADEHMDPRELLAIADRADRELVELPKDADGVPIHVGDTVYGCISGRKSQATGLRLEDAWVILTNHGFGEPHIFTHSSPDSWERIADELDAWCDRVDVDGDACDRPRDLADRIRKLAKEGEHE